jgi:Flp pilus assembly protein TadD
VDEPAWLRLRAARVLAAAELNEDAAPYLQPFTRETTPLVAGLLAAEVAWESEDPDGSAWILRQLSLDHPGNPWVAEAEARHLARVAGDDAARESWIRLAGEGSPVAGVALGTSLREELEPEVLRAAVRGGLERLSRGEQGVASRRATRAVDADALAAGRDLEEAWVMERIASDREAVADLLDQMVFRTDWGPAELARLRDIYPASALLARLDTRLALRQGRLDRARREVERLLDLQPRDAEVHGLYGEILEAQDRTEAARSSYARALEIDAAAPGVFQALTRLHGASGTLEVLLERVRRLRTLSPGDSLRLAHEVELLHRLGRLEEARALADSVRAGGSLPSRDLGGEA